MPVVTPFNLGLLPADLTQWFNLPEGHRYGQVEKLPIQFYLIRLAERLILVDAPSYDFPDDGSLLPEYKGRTAANLLTMAGVHPESISVVIITHPHLDHTLGLVTGGENPTPIFVNAQHYLGAKDRELLRTMEEIERQPLEIVEQAGLLTLVDNTLELGDGLSIIPMPGETPGHQVVHLKTQSSEVYIVGDLFHHVLEFAEADRHPIWSDGPTLQASKTSFVQQIAGSNATVFFTHIEGAYRVKNNNGQIVWEKLIDGF